MKDHPLRHFHRERDALMARVVARAVDRFSGEGGGDPLPLLADAVSCEIARLESLDRRRGERARLKAWRDLGHRLPRLEAADLRHQVEDLTRQYVEDIAGRFDPRIHRFATRLLPWLINRLLAPQTVPRAVRSTLIEDAILSARFAVDGPIAKLEALSRRGPLVLVPTHSSNLDSGVLGWSLHMAGLPPVTYGAGKNLFTNPWVGFLLRNLGAYRVDRRIKHTMYKEILKDYSAVLMHEGYHSLFFPGGTRIRSGAVEAKLKLGLLGTAVEAMAEGVHGISIVPVTLNYALTLEAETLIADELAASRDRREIIEDDEFSRIKPLLGFTRQVLSLDGALVIRFGEPCDPLGNPLDEAGRAVDRAGRPVDAAAYFRDARGADRVQRCREATRMLGETLVASYRRNTVFMATQLVARVVYDRLFDPVLERDGVPRPPPDLARSLGRTVDVATVRDDLARWRTFLDARRVWGERGASHLDENVEAVLAQALQSFRGFHSRPALERQAGQIVVRHPGLLYYYRNRTAHLASPVSGMRTGAA